MKSYVAAAVTLKNFDLALREKIGGCNYIFLLGIAPKGDDWSMFQQQEHIADAVLFAQFDQAPLQIESGCIVKDPELKNGNHARLCGSGRFAAETPPYISQHAEHPA